nr:hypothetical protein [Tanacetum cinerariifolium]
MSAITYIRCVLTQEALDALCDNFHILEEVHLVFPNQNDIIHERPAGKIGLYTRDPDPVAADFNAQDYATLVAHPSLFQNFLKAFLCLVGLRNGHFFFHPHLRSYQIAPDRADSELEASVERLFDEGGSGTQTKRGFPSSKKAEGGSWNPSGASVSGKSRSALQRWLTEAVLNAKVGVTTVPTLPFVTASVSTTPECEDGDHIDSMDEPNIYTIRALQRFVISSDSSHHSGPTIAEVKVDSLRNLLKPSLFFADSSLGADPNTCVFSDLTDSDFLIGGIRTVIDPNTDLQKVYVPQWSVTNGSCLDNGRLFTEFNVGAARQISLSAEIKNLKAQLLLKETKATETTRLRAQTSNLEAVEKSLRDEVNALKGHNVILEKERNAMDVKVTDLEASLVDKERDLTDLNAQLTFVKSPNDNLADQVHELKISSARLQEKITVRAIKKGMQSGLAAGVDHGREGRSLADVVAYNLNDASTEDIMNVLHLEGALVDAPGMNDLQPDIEQLKVHIHRSEDQVVLGETSLSFALCVLHSRVERIRENIAAQRLALVGVWTPLSKPLSVTSLMGEASTPGVVPAASVTTTALSTTFASASSIPPISTDDYKIVGVDSQKGTGTDGRAVADGNVSPFPNVDDVELNIHQ